MSIVITLWTAVIPGEAVWTVLAVASATWVVASWRSRGLVGPGGVVRWFLQSWTGRLVALAAWALAGWHLFCQRP